MSTATFTFLIALVGNKRLAQLGDTPGEEIARRILKGSPSTRIIKITSPRCDVRLVRALDAGVHGFVIKGTGRPG